MAADVTRALGGAGLWGVEFFLAKDGVVFSELSPRPHDTGMVTLSNCFNFNEFELHVRAVLGLPIPGISLQHPAASAVVLADFASSILPNIEGVADAVSEPGIDVRVFGKPSARKYRRMAVAVASGTFGEPMDDIRKRAFVAAQKIRVSPAE